MDRFRSPFVSALLGGLVVAALGALALAAGWIEAGDEEEAPLPSAQPGLAKPPADRGGRGLTVNQIYERDGPGVVFVQAEMAEEEPESPFDLFPRPRERGIATGSGFVIDGDGHILTNAHVVDGTSAIRVDFGEQKSAEAKKVGQDLSTDLALLKVKVDRKLLHPLELGDSGKVRVGDPVVAIGNPFGFDRTVTTGIVSALQRKIEAPSGFEINDVIQTDASINPGNSGGPLLDTAGRVIGINSQIASPGGGSVGIGFAVPIDTAREVVGQLRTRGKVRHAYLGITGSSLREPVLESLNLAVDEGVLVQEVVPGGPAAKAGIRGGKTRVRVGGIDLLLGGDIIAGVEGKEVGEMDQVIDLIARKRPGDEIRLEILRGKQRKTVKVKLGERPSRVRRSRLP